MESAIGAGLETIKVINTIIMDLRSTPNLIQRISSQFRQLNCMLGALHRQSQMYVLSDADMKDWLEHQRTCNTTLRKIEDILEDYAKGSTARVPILRAAKFQFGPKEELSGLMEDLEKCVQFFILFSGVVLQPDARLIQPPQRHEPQEFRKQEPAMSIGQYVQMRVKVEEAGL